MGDSSKKGGKRRVVDYRMSQHFGICHGPLDALLDVRIKDRDAWPGLTAYDDEDNGEADVSAGRASQYRQWLSSLIDLSSRNIAAGSARASLPVITGETDFLINRPKLFGGDEKEGGVIGRVRYQPGTMTQKMAANLAARFGRTPDTMVGYRGIANIFFYGQGRAGFLWAQNNPYIPHPWLRVFRYPRGLDQRKAIIQRGDYLPDANPAHIIYECQTNAIWGAGMSGSAIDEASFNAAADVFIEEQFGLSLIWADQGKIKTFIQEILDHVQAALYVDPQTGLLTLKPIRGDYLNSVNDLFEIGPHNATLKSRKRAAWSETVNEIVVKWTNPDTEKSESMTFHDMANLQMRGGPKSETRDYYGIRNRELASEVGARDIREAAQPLFSCVADCDRTAFRVTEGDVVRLSWPEDNIQSILMRVTSVDRGKPGQPRISLNLTEDIFALEPAQYVQPASSLWTNPSAEPKPHDFVDIVTMPAGLIARSGADIGDDQYPRVVPALFAASVDNDDNTFAVHADVVQPNGQSIKQQISVLTETTRTTLAEPLVREATSTTGTMLFGTLYGGSVEPEANTFAWIGSDEATSEIVLIETAETGYTLRRGLWDTVPRDWPVNTPVWLFADDAGIVDRTERSVGEVVEYVLTPRSSLGELPLSQAQTYTETLLERPYLPYRPANVMVAGTADGLLHYPLQDRPTTIAVSWANRNRLIEDADIRRWDDGNVPGEDGQSTRIIVRNDADGQFVTMYVALSGTSFDIPVADIESVETVRVEVHAERNNELSFQAWSRIVTFEQP